jgi:hypothetical protein
MPKAKTNTVMNNVAQTLVGSSLSNMELVELGASLASARFDALTASEQYDSLAKSARESGLKLVDTRKTKGVAPEHVEQTKAFKAGFIDTLVSKGLQAKTAQNYYQELVPCINEGKVFSTNTSKQNSAKGKGKGSQKGKGSTDSEKMVSAWLNVWKLSDVAPESFAYIEGKVEDGMSLVDALTDYLKSEGQNLASEESEESAE